MHYYFFFLLLALTILLKKKKFSVCLYIVFSGFRYKIGNDWFNYIGLIEGIQNIGEINNMVTFSQEPIFKYSIFLISFFPFDADIIYQILVFTSVTLNGLLIYKILIKHSYNFIAFYLFIAFSLFREFDVLRQSFALLLLHYAFYLRQYNQNYLIIFTATLFHYTGGIFLFFKILKKINFPKFLIIIFGLVQVFNLRMLETLKSVNFSKLSYYLIELESKPSYITFNELVCALCFMFLAQKIRNKGLSSIENFALKFLGFQLILLIIFNGFTEIQDRLSFYFYFSEAIALSSSLFIFSNRSRKIIIFLFILLPFIKTNRVLAVEENKLSYLPYKNILWSDTDNSDAESNWLKKHKK